MAQPTGYPTPCENCQIIFLDSFSEARAIQFCPLHAHAPAMRDELAKIADLTGPCDGKVPECIHVMCQRIRSARALLRQIEGQP